MGAAVFLTVGGILLLWLRWRGRSYRQAQRLNDDQVYAQASDARFPRAPGFRGRARRGGRRL